MAEAAPPCMPSLNERLCLLLQILSWQRPWGCLPLGERLSSLTARVVCVSLHCGFFMNLMLFALNILEISSPPKF